MTSSNDVALAFRYPAQGLCGLVSWQMWEVFRAFGYDARRIDSIDGAVGVGTYVDPNTGTYSQSHSTSEVYVTDLDKWIIQDATFNFLYNDEAGNFLSWDEARAALYDGSGLVFSSFRNYVDYQGTGTYRPEATPP